MHRWFRLTELLHVLSGSTFVPFVPCPFLFCVATPSYYYALDGEVFLRVALWGAGRRSLLVRAAPLRELN